MLHRVYVETVTKNKENSVQFTDVPIYIDTNAECSESDADVGTKKCH